MWHYFPSFTRAITLEAFMATKIVSCNEWIPENEHESLIITFNKFILCPSYCRSNAGSGKIELSAIDFCHELILCFWEHDRENVLQQAVMVKRGTQHILGRATMIKKSITFSAPSWNKRSNNWIRSWCVSFFGRFCPCLTMAPLFHHMCVILIYISRQYRSQHWIVKTVIPIKKPARFHCSLSLGALFSKSFPPHWAI